MQYQLQVFKYDDARDFRIIDREGEPWFVLADVCRALGLQPKNGSFSHHAERLDEDERSHAAVPLPSVGGGVVTMSVINEPGLYNLILTSRSEGAKRFKKWVTSEVLPTIRKTGGYSLRPNMPAFIRRYSENADRVDPGHFSVIGELVIRIWGRLETAGYMMKDRAVDGRELRPDVSVGRGFAEWMRQRYPDRAHEFSFYPHKTDEWEGDARQYPRGMWPLFMEYVDDVWIPKHAEAYFKTRDPAAIPYLQKLLPSPAAARPGMTKRVTGPKSSAATPARGVAPRLGQRLTPN